MFRPLLAAVALVTLAGAPAFAATVATPAAKTATTHTVAAKPVVKSHTASKTAVKASTGKSASTAPAKKLASNLPRGHAHKAKTAQTIRPVKSAA